MNYKKTLTVIAILFLTACGGGSSDSGSGELAGAGAITRVVALSDSFGTGFGLATPWPPRL